MGVNELWKLFREEGLMQEWSVETDGPGAQKAVAEQIEGDWPKSTHMAQVLRLSFQLRLYPCRKQYLADRFCNEQQALDS